MSKFFDRFTYLTTKYLKIGSVQINEISTDGTFAGNSDLCVPTEKAVKTYVDLNAPAVSAHTLTGADHTVTGLSTGHFLKATGATTFGFAAHGLTANDVGAIAKTTGTATGDIMYYDGDDWVVLTPSAAGDMIYFDGTDWQVVSASAGDLFYFDGTDVTTVTASASGDIVYYDGTDFQVLAIGTTDQVLAASSSGLPYWKNA